MTKKKSTNKALINILLFILLPILSVLIGYYGVNLFIGNHIANNDTKSIEIEEKIPKDDIIAGKSDNDRTENQELEKPDEEQPSSSEDDQVTYEYIIEIPTYTLYNLQVASFANKENAEKFKKELNEKDLSAYIYYENSYRIYLASGYDKKIMSNLKEQFRDEFSDVFVSTMEVVSDDFKHNSEDTESLRVIELEINRLLQLFDIYSEYSSSIAFDSEAKDSFDVFIITQGNEVQKSINRLKNLDVDQDLERIVDKLLAIYNNLNEMYGVQSKSNELTYKIIWDEFLNILFQFKKIT